MLGSLIRIFVTRLAPLGVLAIAIFLGWLSQLPMPEGTLFGIIYPITKGYVPPIWSGGFKECPVPPVPPPAEITLEARPAKESFVRLPGFIEEEPKEEAPEEMEARDLEASLDKYASFQMPQQGIGMCCRYTAYDAESVRRTILWYLIKGGRHIDSADMYLNHEWIGQALQIAMKDYGIPREEIWVTTKLWPRMYGPNATAEAIPRMLKELQLDYIDLVLMHQPRSPLPPIAGKTECDKLGYTPKECRLETWKTLSKIRESGVVHHVGVSNFNARQLQEIQALGDAVAPIANNQFQYNPWVPDHLHETFDYCQQEGISVTAYSSFSGSAMQHMQAFSVDTLKKIAKDHETTAAQILLKWAIQKGAIVIPGTGNPKHMAENLNAYNIELSPKEMADIDGLRRDESAKLFFVIPPDES